jgi:hypothetical protein
MVMSSSSFFFPDPSHHAGSPPALPMLEGADFWNISLDDELSLSYRSEKY